MSGNSFRNIKHLILALPLHDDWSQYISYDPITQISWKLFMQSGKRLLTLKLQNWPEASKHPGVLSSKLSSLHHSGSPPLSAWSLSWVFCDHDFDREMPSCCPGGTPDSFESRQFLLLSKMIQGSYYNNIFKNSFENNSTHYPQTVCWKLIGFQKTFSSFYRQIQFFTALKWPGDIRI